MKPEDRLMESFMDKIRKVKDEKRNDPFGRMKDDISRSANAIPFACPQLGTYIAEKLNNGHPVTYGEAAGKNFVFPPNFMKDFEYMYENLPENKGKGKEEANYTFNELKYFTNSTVEPKHLGQSMPFANTSNMEEVTIPSTWTEIPKECFFSSEGLKKVNFLSDSKLEELGSSCFANRAIHSIVLPDTVKKIGSSAFDGNNIPDFKFPSHVEEIGGMIFGTKAKDMHNLVIPPSIRKIDNNAFTWMEYLKFVNIPNFAPKYFDSVAPALSTELTLTDAYPMFVIEYMGRRKLIDVDYLVKHKCQVYVPDELFDLYMAKIEEKSKYGTQLHKKSELKENSAIMVDNIDNQDAITESFMNRIRKVKDEKQGSYINRTKENISDSLNAIHFAYPRLDEYISNELNDHRPLTYADVYNKEFYFPNNFLREFEKFYKNCPENKGKSDDDLEYTFNELKYFKKAKIIEREYGDYCAFSGVTFLTEVTIPSTWNSIPNNCFSDSERLRIVNFPKDIKLKTIGHSSFDSDISLTSLKLPETVRKICSSAFFGSFGAEGALPFRFPSHVTEIGSTIFSEETSFSAASKLILPPSIRKINHDAFTGMKHLQLVEIPDFNPKYFDSVAPALSTKFHFYGNSCKFVIKYTGAEKLIDIYPLLNYGREVYVPDQLYDLYLGKMQEVFKKTAIDPAQLLFKLSEYKEKDKIITESVTESFMDKIRKVRDEKESSKMSRIRQGMDEELNAIPFACSRLGNYLADELNNGRPITYKEAHDKEYVFSHGFLAGFESEYRHFPENVGKLSGDIAYTFNEFRFFEKAVLKPATNTVEEGSQSASFGGAALLSEITIPDTLVEIPDGCFAETGQLRTVHFSKNSMLKSVGSMAFSGYYSHLKEIVLPYSVTNIDDGAFGSYGGDMFHFPSSLKKIGKSIFFRLGNKFDKPLHELVPPPSVEEVAYNAFFNLQNLDYVEIPAFDPKFFKSVMEGIFSFYENPGVVIVVKYEYYSPEIASKLKNFLSKNAEVYVPDKIFNDYVNDENLKKLQKKFKDNFLPMSEFKGKPKFNVSSGQVCESFINKIRQVRDEKQNDPFGRQRRQISENFNAIPFACRQLGKYLADKLNGGIPITYNDAATKEYYFENMFFRKFEDTFSDLPENKNKRRSELSYTFNEFRFFKNIKLRYNEATKRDDIFEGFASTNFLSEVTIPPIWTILPYDCFESCEGLKKVTFLEGTNLIEIGRNCFVNTPSLHSLKLPDTVKILDSNSLETLQVKYFSIPPKVEVFGRNVFSEESLLKRLIIPASVKKVDERAFYDTDTTTGLGNLTYAEIPNFNPMYFDNVAKGIVNIRTKANAPVLIKYDNSEKRLDLTKLLWNLSIVYVSDNLVELYRNDQTGDYIDLRKNIRPLSEYYSKKAEKAYKQRIARMKKVQGKPIVRKPVTESFSLNLSESFYTNPNDDPDFNPSNFDFD